MFIGAGLAFFGLSVDSVYAEVPGLVAGVLTITDVLNKWQDWHGFRAVLAAILVSTVLSLIGWQLIENSFLHGLEFVEFLSKLVMVTMIALGVHPNYKKAIDSVK